MPAAGSTCHSVSLSLAQSSPQCRTPDSFLRAAPHAIPCRCRAAAAACIKEERYEVNRATGEQQTGCCSVLDGGQRWWHRELHAGIRHKVEAVDIQLVYKQSLGIFFQC